MAQVNVIVGGTVCIQRLLCLELLLMLVEEGLLLLMMLLLLLLLLLQYADIVTW